MAAGYSAGVAGIADRSDGGAAARVGGEKQQTLLCREAGAILQKADAPLQSSDVACSPIPGGERFGSRLPPPNAGRSGRTRFLGIVGYKDASGDFWLEVFSVDGPSPEECCCLMATESTGRLLAQLGGPSIVRGIVLDIGAKVAVGRSPPRLRIAETT